MSEITVRALGEDDWQQFRDIRLMALRDSPDAFVATSDQEAALDEKVTLVVGNVVPGVGDAIWAMHALGAV